MEMQHGVVHLLHKKQHLSKNKLYKVSQSPPKANNEGAMYCEHLPTSYLQ